MTWYEQLGFSENPLDLRPNTALVGLEKEHKKLTSHIQKGDVCFLHGFTGSGKTSLLLSLRNQLNEFEFLYLNAEDLPKDFHLEKEIKRKRSITDIIRLRKYPSKPLVLMLDEFQATDANLVLEVKGKWEKEQGLHSVVIAQISREMLNATGSFKERIGNRIVSLRSLEASEMKEILRKRLKDEKKGIDYLKRFQPEAVDFLVEQANTNPRRLLEYTDTIFDYHYQKFQENNPMLKDKYQASVFAIKDILSAHESQGFVPLGAFTEEEVRVLKAISKFDVATHIEVADEMKIPMGVAAGLLGSLKRKGGITSSGKKNSRKVWELCEGIKRQLVQV